MKILLHSQRQEVRSRFNDWKSSESSESSPEILKNPEPASLNLKSKPLLDLAKSCTKKPQSNHKRVAFELDQWNGLIDSLNKVTIKSILPLVCVCKFCFNIPNLITATRFNCAKETACT